MRTPFRSEPITPEVAAAQAEARKRRRVIFGVVGAILLVIGYFILAAFLPRWWGRQVGDWCRGSFTKGLIYGLGFGLICTFVPIAIAATTLNRRLNHQMRGVILVIAVAIAAPNLLTLSIAVGSGGGAHAGDRLMTDRAPFFRGATLIGAILAIVLFLLAVWQYRAGRRVRTLKRNAKVSARQDNSGSISAAPIAARGDSTPAATPKNIDPPANSPN